MLHRGTQVSGRASCEGVETLVLLTGMFGSVCELARMHKLIVAGAAFLVLTGCSAPPQPAASSPSPMPSAAASRSLPKTEQEAVQGVDRLGSAGEFLQAKLAADAALRQWPDNWQLLAQRGGSEQMLSENEEALKDFTAALKHAPADQKWRLYNSRAQSYAGLGKRDEAEKDYAAALKAAGDKVEPARIQMIHHLRGRNLLEATHFKQAIPCFDAALELTPDDHEALGMRALCYYRLKDKKRYQADLAKLRKLNKTTADALEGQISQTEGLSPSNRQVLAGLEQMQAGNPTAAMACFDRAIEIDPKNYEAWDKKGALLQHQKKYAQAVKIYDKALALQKNEATLYNRANCYLAMERAKEARADFEEFLKIGTNAEALEAARKALADLDKQ